MRRVKDNIGRERPTQVDRIGRIVGFSRGMRGNKRGARRKKTYARRENWRVSRSFTRDSRR